MTDPPPFDPDVVFSPSRLATHAAEIARRLRTGGDLDGPDRPGGSVDGIGIRR